MRRICQDGLWGAVDSAGNLMVPFRYEEFEKFHYGTAWVKEQGKWGLTNKYGNMVLPCAYEQRQNVLAKNKYYWVRKNGKWGMVLRCNGSCQEILSCEYDEAGMFHFPYVLVKKGKWGVVDKNGKTVIAFVYDEIQPWHGLGCRVRKNDRWGLVDWEGAYCEYEVVGEHHCGRFRFKKDGKWGYGTVPGRTIVPPIYDYALDFEHPWVYSRLIYAKVKKNGRWGLIDREGSLVIPCEYEKIEFTYRYDVENMGYIYATKDGKRWWGTVRELQIE